MCAMQFKLWISAYLGCLPSTMGPPVESANRVKDRVPAASVHVFTGTTALLCAFFIV